MSPDSRPNPLPNPPKLGDVARNTFPFGYVNQKSIVCFRQAEQTKIAKKWFGAFHIDNPAAAVRDGTMLGLEVSALNDLASGKTMPDAIKRLGAKQQGYFERRDVLK